MAARLDLLEEFQTIIGSRAPGVASPPISSAPVASQAVRAASAATQASFQPLSLIKLPLDYDNLLESFLASGRTGLVFPYFVRQLKTVPAGSTSTLITTIPSGDTAAVVYLLKLQCDTYSPEFYVTLQSDDLPALLTDVSMIEPIDVLGSFLPPAHTQGLYTLTNNDSVDITFIADVQLAIMTPQFARTVYEPLVQGQFSVLQALGSEFTAYQGGAAS